MAAKGREMVNGELQCSKCLKFLTPSSFAVNKACKYGLNTTCKSCHSARYYATRVIGRPRQAVIDGKKICSLCGKMLDVSEFGSHKLTSTGLESRCRKCMILRTQRRASKDVRSFLRTLSQANKGNNSVRASRRWLLADNHVTPSFLLSLWEKQGGKCAITGMPMTHLRGQGRVPTNASVDRIDSTIGYVPENVQLVCAIVNTMKNTLTSSALHFWCTAIRDGLESQQTLVSI